MSNEAPPDGNRWRSTAPNYRRTKECGLRTIASCSRYSNRHVISNPCSKAAPSPSSPTTKALCHRSGRRRIRSRRANNISCPASQNLQLISATSKARPTWWPMLCPVLRKSHPKTWESPTSSPRQAQVHPPSIRLKGFLPRGPPKPSPCPFQS